MAEEKINGTIITLFSTASAVGKTLVGCNFASEVARQGARVCLADFDLQFGDVCNYLQLQPQRTVADLQKAMETQGTGVNIREYLTPFLHINTSFHVLPCPKGLDEAYNISPKILKEIVKRLQGMFDYVIIDTTSMFSVTNLELLDMSTIVMFLGIVDFIPTIKNMKIGSDTLKSLNYDKNKLRFTLNRSDAKTRIGINDVERLMGTKFDYVLPNDFAASSKSIQTGIPLVLDDERSTLGESMKVLVGRYINRAFAHAEEEPRRAPGMENVHTTAPVVDDNIGWFSKLFG